MRLSTRERVATLTLCAPPVNAVNDAWLDSFERVLEEIAGDRRISVVRLASDQRVFCAGADLAFMRGSFATGEGRHRLIEFTRRMAAVYAKVERLRAVTICEIGGAALGGGLELALACDLRVAASTARLGLPEAKLGLLAAAGGTQRLTRLCGHGVARRLIFGAEIVTGAEAVALGLVQWAADAEALASTVDGIVSRIAALSPEAVAASKACVAEAGVSGTAGFDLEIQSSARLLAFEDTQERVRQFLGGKR